MWESPLSLVPPPLSPIPLFLSFLSSQIPLSLCSLSPKSSFLSLSSSFTSSSISFCNNILTLSRFLFFEVWLCEQVRACHKCVNHRYECINIPNFFLCCMPKHKIKANAGSFIRDVSLAATSCEVVEMFYLAWEMVIFEN